MANDQKQMLSMLEAVEQQVLADLSDSARIKRITAKVMTLIQLYSGVVCAGKIDRESASEVDRVLAKISAKLNIDYESQKAAALQSCYGEGTEAKPKGAPKKATVNLNLPSFAEMVRAHFLKVEYARNQDIALTNSNMIEALETVPSRWQGTKKEWLESKKAEIENARQMRDEAKKLATRYKNDTLTAEEYPDEVAALDGKIARAEREQKGVLTEEQRQDRLDFLLERIFQDEYAGGDYDFFPTPDDIIERYMVQGVKLPANAKVLEPSAGRGNIADAVRAEFPKADIDVVELSDIRREVLFHKGYRLVGGDFMEVGVESRDAKGRAILSEDWKGKYDAVFMNPPFLKGAGREHVRRAMQMLKVGGTLKAVIPTGYVDGTGQDNIFFQEWAKQRGSFEYVIIRESEYNKNHDRKITIDLAVLTFVKEREIEERKATVSTEESLEATNEIRQKWSGKVTLPTKEREPDAEFVTPKIITARPEITEPAPNDYIPGSLRKRYNFIKDHVYEGVNKAIYGLDRTGGFLLADGTGTGKTIQALLTARHYWEKTGQPVMIFTVDDRVVQGSFFADAKKLGWAAPDYIDTETSKRPNRPKNYEGLYDDATPQVTLYRRERGIQPGINVTTYNTLSNWKGLESTEAAYDEAFKKLKVQKDLLDKRKRQIDEQMDAKYPKGRDGKRRKDKDELGIQKETKLLKDAATEELVTNHPASREFYLADKARREGIMTAMREFMGSAQLVIFDEAHKVKNAGDGLDQDAMSIRARLALGIMNQVPRVLYMTATPADRPFDILYLKKLGFWRDENEFKTSMNALGYTYEPEKTNANGEVIREAQWKSGGRATPEQVVQANAEMRRLFAMATEDGNMIRREIELRNLNVKMHKFAAPQSALDMMEQILDHYTKEVNGRIVRDWQAALQVQMQELERYKIDKALEIIDEAVQQGKQVVTFCYTVEEGEEEKDATNTKKAGMVEEVLRILQKRYGEDAVGALVGTSGDYENFRRLENVQNFQKGLVRVIVGTITSGGTGVNLDDTTGRNPREMVVITPPLSFINVMQGIGRIVRANTKSRSTAHFIFTDAPVDAWLSQLLATKFSTLNATVEGESKRLSLEAAESVEDTGSQGVISLIATTAPKDNDGGPTKHPLRVQTNRKWDGPDYPAEMPYWVEAYGTPKNSTLAIGGISRKDLDSFVAENADLIADLKLEPNVNRSMQKYRGPYYGRRFDDRNDEYFRVLDALLNVIDPKLKTGFSIKSKFAVGDTFIVLQSVVFAHLAAGTIGRIVKVRQKLSEGETWRYDVEVDGTIHKAVDGKYLGMPDGGKITTIPYEVGDSFSMRRPENAYDPYGMRVSIKIVEKTEHTVTIERRVWETQPRSYYYGGLIARTEEQAEPITRTIDILDWTASFERGFADFADDEKQNRWGGYQETFVLVDAGSNAASNEPQYSRVADNTGRKYDLQYYLEASARNLLKTSRTAQGIVDVSASKEKADKIVKGLTADTAKSETVKNYQEVIRYLWSVKNRRWQDTMPKSWLGRLEFLVFLNQINQRITAGVVEKGQNWRTDDSDKYPYTLLKYKEVAQRTFNFEAMQNFVAQSNGWDSKYPTTRGVYDDISFAAWMEWRINLTDHFYADGVGKTSKAMATLVLMRGDKPLPDYPDNKEFFKYASKTRYVPDGVVTPYEPEIKGAYTDDGAFARFVEFYRSLFPKQSTENTTGMDDQLCRIQTKLGRLEIAWRGVRSQYSAEEIAFVEKKLASLKAQIGGTAGQSGCATCPPRNADGTICVTTKCLQQLETTCEVGAQTWSLEAGTIEPSDSGKVHGATTGWYSGKTGYPTKERAALHKRIIDELRDKTVCAKSIYKRPIAVLTGGAPGSGKSSFIKEEAPWLLDPEKFMHIDADAMREKLPEYAGWNATLTHEEAGVLVKAALREIAQPCKRNVLYDGTMNNLRKYNELIDTFESLGYDVYIIYMDIPKAVSKERVLGRYQQTGRYVPTYVIDDFYKSIETANAFDKLKSRVKGYVLVNGLNRQVLERGGEAIPSVGAQRGQKVKQNKTDAADSFVPPADVQAEAKRGLELRRNFNRGGTEVGVARARDLSNGRAVSMDTIKRMVSYFARHEVDKEGPNFNSRFNPSAGKIAWLLWGGDAGRKWATGILEAAEKKNSEPQVTTGDQQVRTMPIGDVHTDPRRFQPRSSLSQQKVSAIVDNYDPRKFDPLVVWQDKGKYYVLAGHHRLAAAEQLGLKTVPVRIYSGTEAEAIAYAWTSNVATRAQTNAENARYLRKLRGEGIAESAIRRSCDELYGKDCSTVLGLSWLPDDAVIFEDMSQFAAASDEYKELETMARWIGQVVKTYNQLTVNQVNELYRHLRKNFRITGKRFRSANEYAEWAERILAIRFPIGVYDNAALNLDDTRPRTDTERMFDEKEAQLNAEIKDLKQFIEDQRKKLLKVEELKASGKTASAEPVLLSMAGTEQRIVLLQRELMDLRQKRSAAVAAAVEAQPALFGLADRRRGKR